MRWEHQEREEVGTASQRSMFEGEEMLRELFEFAPDPILVIRGDGIIVRVNEEAERKFGYNRRELVNQPVEMLIPDQYRSHHIEVRDAYINSPRIRSMGSELNIRGRRKDGTEFPMDVMLSPMGWSTERVTIAIVRDITERKKVEEALQTSEKRSKELLASVTDYIYSVHFQKDSVAVTSHGPGCRAITGYNPEDYADDPELWYRMVHPDDRPAVLAAAVRTAEGGMQPALEHRIFHRDGSIRWVRNQRVLRYNPEGELSGYDGLVSDITERKVAEEALQKALADLQKTNEELKTSQMLLIHAEKMEAVGLLAAGVAHEVKNPLAILLMSLDYLSDTLPDPNGDVEPVLKDMRHAVERADTIIHAMLDFSTSEKLELQPADLNSVIEQAALLVKHSMDLHHVSFEKSLDPELPPTVIDRLKVEQVFVNLFTNSIDSMPAGGVLSVRSFLKLLSDPERDAKPCTGQPFQTQEAVAVVEIEDTGTGIPPYQISKIYDPFFTTKPAGKGTGLGLAVTRKIMDLHGGSLEITNRNEKGVRALLQFKALNVLNSN